MKSVQSIAERIKRMCETKGITVNKMLVDSGAGARTYHNMVAGSYPSADKLVKIANYLGVTVDYLVGNEESEEAKGLSPEKQKLLDLIDTLTDEQAERFAELIKTMR